MAVSAGFQEGLFSATGFRSPSGFQRRWAMALHPSLRSGVV